MGLADRLGPLLAPRAGPQDAAIGRASLTLGGIGEALFPKGSPQNEAAMQEDRRRLLEEQGASDSALGIAGSKPPARPDPRLPNPGAAVAPSPTDALEAAKAAMAGKKVAKESLAAAAQLAAAAANAERSAPSIGTTPPAPTDGAVPGQETKPAPGAQGTMTVGKYQRSALEDRANARPGTADYADSRPYSEKVRGLQADVPDTPAFDMKTKGGWTFSGGYGKGPRVGTGTLSGLEQRTARREWLDTRVKQEQGTEDADQARAVQKAKAQYEMKAAAMDPTTLARIQAEGKFGPEQMRLTAQASQIDQAFREYRALAAAADEFRAQGRTADADRADERARQLAAILMGHAPSSPRGADALAGIFGGGMTSPAAGAATTEVK